jgi:hypothetical protein
MTLTRIQFITVVYWLKISLIFHPYLLQFSMYKTKNEFRCAFAISLMHDTTAECIPVIDHGCILRERGDRPSLQSVFKELIICEIHISIFFNVDNFITKSNYAWL